MPTLLASSTVLITIICSLIFGIACGYAVISSILRAFSYQTEKSQAASATQVICRDYVALTFLSLRSNPPDSTPRGCILKAPIAAASARKPACLRYLSLRENRWKVWITR